jgi:hypothetical protein
VKRSAVKVSAVP